MSRQAIRAKVFFFKSSTSHSKKIRALEDPDFLSDQPKTKVLSFEELLPFPPQKNHGFEAREPVVRHREERPII